MLTIWTSETYLDTATRTTQACTRAAQVATKAGDNDSDEVGERPESHGTCPE